MLYKDEREHFGAQNQIQTNNHMKEKDFFGYEKTKEKSLNKPSEDQTNQKK